MLKDNQSLGNLIRYYRTVKGYSQDQLARHLNVTNAAISNWERGVARPSVEIAFYLSREMDITLDEFYVLTEQSYLVKGHSINDTIFFPNFDIKLTNLEIDDLKDLITIDLNIRGIVTESIIEEDFDVFLIQKELNLRPIKKQIAEFTANNNQEVDPSMKFIPFFTRNYELKLKFNTQNHKGFDIHINFQNKTNRVILSDELIKLFKDGLHMDFKNRQILKTTLFDYIKFLIINQKDEIALNQVVDRIIST